MPCRLRLCIALLLLGALWVPSGAQVVAEPGVSVLVYHPYPDDADPLGFPFRGGVDAFTARHAFRYDGVPPYPFIVLDGRAEIAGIPDPSAPMDSTTQALGMAWGSRASEPAPLAMRLEAVPDDGLVRATLDLLPHPDTGLGPQRVWMALIEDHVFFRPPPKLSNGVEDHRFTVRAIVDLGIQPLQGNASTLRHAHTFRSDPQWDEGRLSVVAWVQAGPADTRFDPHEVLQSVTDALDDGGTLQTSRAVLVEMVSATWCDTCLYGDRAVEALAAAQGLAPGGEDDGGRYARPPGGAAWLGLLAGALLAAVVLRRSRQNRSRDDGSVQPPESEGGQP